MKIKLVPMLRVQRDLYDIPPGSARFQRYLQVMTGGTRDIILPLARMNPMGKEHVAALYDALLAIDAEVVAQGAVREAGQRLAGVQGEAKVGLVVADDLGGGWTNRYLTETATRFDGRAEIERGWAVALLWTSDEPTRDRVREAVLTTIYRTRYQQQYGLPRILAQMMRQEGLAAAFAGQRRDAFNRTEMAAIRKVIRPHLHSADFPTAFACLYGDEAARSVGYPALGLPARAGYAAAIEEIRRDRLSPDAELLGPSARIQDRDPQMEAVEWAASSLS